MEYTEIIYLVPNTEVLDSIGNDIPVDGTKVKTYAKVQSVRTSEFYNASMTGLSPSIEFVLKKLNYSGEEEIEWNNARYEVIRVVYPKNKFDIVLVCSKKIGVV